MRVFDTKEFNFNVNKIIDRYISTNIQNINREEKYRLKAIIIKEFIERTNQKILHLIPKNSLEYFIQLAQKEDNYAVQRFLRTVIPDLNKFLKYEFQLFLNRLN
jgi:hypothetical protein